MRQQHFLSQQMFRGVLVVALALVLAGAALLVLPAYDALAQDFDDIAGEIEEIRAMAPTYEESFRADDGTWDVDTDLDTSNATIASSNYRITVVDEQTFYWGTSAQSASNLLIEVDAYRIGGPADNEFGLVVRHEDITDFYAFLASSDGYYKIQKQVDDAWEDIVPWTLTELVDQTEGAVNRIGVYAQDTTLALLINGEIVDVIEDDSFAAGAIGLAAGSYDEAGVEIAFDDLVLWDLNEESASLVLPIVTAEPADEPVAEPTDEPVAEPTDEPVAEPTDEPVAEPTDEPVEEPVETPEPVSIDVTAQLDAIRNGEITFSDDFRQDEEAWSLPEGDSSVAAIASRRMTIEVLETNWMAWANLDGSNAADFLAEVDATQTAGTLDAEFGILFHYRDTENFNFFAVNADGSWSYWLMQEGSWTEAQAWTQTDALALGLGETNRLGVLAEQGLVTFLINDEAVGQYQGEANVGGEIALTIGTFAEAGVAGEFDNFDLWVQAEGTVFVDDPIVSAVTIGEDMADRVAGLAEADPFYSTDFRRDDGVWSAAVDEDVEHYNQSRSLRILIDREQWTSWALQQDLAVGDFYAEVDTERIVGPVVGEYGLVYRFVDDDNFYAYYISGNGYWSAYSLVDGEWTTLVEWTQHEALDFAEGAVNRLGILAEGSLLTFFINGVQVGQIEDDSFDAGSIGLTAGTFEEPGLEVAFDNFSYWEVTE